MAVSGTAIFRYSRNAAASNSLTRTRWCWGLLRNFTTYQLPSSASRRCAWAPPRIFRTCRTAVSGIRKAADRRGRDTLEFYHREERITHGGTRTTRQRPGGCSGSRPGAQRGRSRARVDEIHRHIDRLWPLAPIFHRILGETGGALDRRTDRCATGTVRALPPRGKEGRLNGKGAGRPTSPTEGSV